MPVDVLPRFANKILNEFRENAQLNIPGRDPFRFTISIGFAVMTPVHGVPIERNTLLDMADKAMYAAKMGGRDRFHISHLSTN